MPTVAGAPLRPDDALRLDGHAHAWIDRPPGVRDGPILDDETLVVGGLDALARAAAPRRAALVDCQPPGCGRDARALARLSERTGVAIAATTGFHLARHYPDGRRPWPDAGTAADAFAVELEHGLVELPDRVAAVVKAAHTGRPGDDAPLWEAAVEASRRTGALLLVHTERGAGAAELLATLIDAGLPAGRVYLCHVDKRADPGLHRELAAAGALLGYDTFLRPAYEPERTTWPLVEGMLEAGHADAVALGLDLADAAMWSTATHHPAASGAGPSALIEVVESRLRALGARADDLDALLGGSFLARALRADDRSRTAVRPLSAGPTAP